MRAERLRDSTEALLERSRQLKEANATIRLLEAQNVALEKRLTINQIGWRTAGANIARFH